MTSPWEDYLAAARELDECRAQAASDATTQHEALRSARHELASVRRRASIGQARLAEIMARARLAPPMITPTEPVLPLSELSQATAALHAARADLDLADATLSEAERPGSAGLLAGWSPAARNGLVYGGFAVVVLIAQIILLLAVSGTVTSILGMGCAVVLPIFGYVLAWLTIGLVFRSASGVARQVDRTPILGVAICTAPVLLICAGFSLLSVM